MVLQHLRSLIQQPRSAVNSDSEFSKDIWACEDLTGDDLKAGLAAGQIKLNVATTEYIEALKARKRKLEEEIASFIKYIRSGPRELLRMQRQSDDGMRSEICKLVVQRWWIENATEEAKVDDWGQ